MSASKQRPSVAPDSLTPHLRRDILILLITCLSLSTPFLGKPAHVDDPMYIWAARQISAHPLDFYGFNVNWSGHTEPMTAAMMNPPLLPYCLAAASKALGWSEIALHAALLPFIFLSAVGLYFLARQYCRHALCAALLMLICPAFLVSSTTLMCEVPLLCLWIWTVQLWSLGCKRSAVWYPLAGLLAGLAMLTKYSAVSIVPLLIVHAVLHRASARHRAIQIAAMLIPVVMLAGYNHYCAVHYGRGLFLNAIGFSSSFSKEQGISTPAKFLDALTFVGGGGLAAALVGFIAADKWSRATTLLCIALMTCTARMLFKAPGGWSSPWAFHAQAGLLAAAGVGIAMTCIADLARSHRSDFRESLFLVLWIGGVFIFAAGLNWSINARSILPLVPPVCIMTQRAIERRPQRHIRPYILAGSVAVLVCVLVTVADYESAVANRWAVGQLMKRQSGQRVWFTGHWGFQYYMQQAGAWPLEDQAPACQSGDMVIMPLNNYGVPSKQIPLQYLRSVNADVLPFLTPLNGPMGADFYYSPGDRLPFVFGPVPPETFVIFRVSSRVGS